MRRFDFLGLRGERVMFGLCLLMSALVFGKTVRCGDLRRGVSVAWRGCGVAALGLDFGVGLIFGVGDLFGLGADPVQKFKTEDRCFQNPPTSPKLKPPLKGGGFGQGVLDTCPEY